MRKEIGGILCALVTPLNKYEQVDREAAVRIAKNVEQAGTDGLLVLGSTGEQIALTRENKRAMISAVRESCPDLPLIAGCGATGTTLAIQNVRDAQESGADAVIVTPPCFYPFGADALTEYYTAIANASDVPVYLYNISRFVGTKIPVETVRQLLDHPKIRGIKESDRDEDYVAELLSVSRDRPDFAVLQGSERIFLRSFDRGCKGGVTVVGNLAPEIAPAMYRAWKSGNRPEAERLQQKLLDYVAVITMHGRFPQELKEAMSSKGLCESYMTSPFIPLTREQNESLHRALAELEAKY